MATATADNVRIYGGGEPPEDQEFPAAVDIIYEGSAVGTVDASGYAVPLVSNDTTHQFVGFAMRQCDNSAGSAGDKTVTVRTKGLLKDFPVTGVAITDVGALVYATDDNLFDLTAGANEIAIGRVERFVSSGVCDVRFYGETHRIA